MILGSLLLATVAQASPAILSPTACMAVVPTGAVLRFAVTPIDDGVSLTALPGSAWPEAPLTAVAHPKVKPASFSADSFGIVTPSMDVVVRFGKLDATGKQTMTLHGVRRGTVINPIAFGYCSPAVTNAAPPVASSAPGNPFDEKRNLDKCTLMATSGATYHFSMLYEENQQHATLTSVEPAVWSGPNRVAVARKEGLSGPFVAILGDPKLNSGTVAIETNYIDQNNEATLIQFLRTGGQNSDTAGAGYAICPPEKVVTKTVTEVVR